MHLITAILLVLAGCASTPAPDINAARNSWQGVSYDEVVASWGIRFGAPSCPTAAMPIPGCRRP